MYRLFLKTILRFCAIYRPDTTLCVDTELNIYKQARPENKQNHSPESAPASVAVMA